MLFRAVLVASLSARARLLDSTSFLTRFGYFDQNVSAMYPPIETPTTAQSFTWSSSRNSFRLSAISSIVHGDAGCDSPKPRISGAMTRNRLDRAATCDVHIVLFRGKA